MAKHMPGDLELVIGTKDTQLDLDLAAELLEDGIKSITKEIDLMIIKEIEKEIDDIVDWKDTIKEDKYKWYKYNGIYSKKNDIEPKSLLDIIYKHHIKPSKKNER